MTWRPWREAWHDALYGPAGFYRQPDGPAAHFRTASHASASGLLGRALAGLARRRGCTAVLDVGAGRGELLASVADADPGLRLAGVDVVPRPASLPESVQWLPEPPAALHDTLLVGWELLDAVPCTVLETDGGGLPREVLVDRHGRERLGPPATAADLAWCRRWWPLEGAPPGTRAEVGTPREELWTDLASRLRSGVALAVDYDHDAITRPPGGTLTGYRAGRQVPPVPDGATDVTAHVALDGVAAALGGLSSSGAQRTTTLTRQAAELARLGVTAGRPALQLAVDEPLAYVRALQQAGEAAELLDPDGLGAFGWLLHEVAPR